MASSFVGRAIACVLAGILGWILHPGCAMAQYEAIYIQIDVAPNVLNIQSEGTVVTVHTDLPYNEVEGASVTLNGIEIYYWKADARGFFVAKFPMDEVKALAASEENQLIIGDYNTLVLEGTTAGGEYFSGEQEIMVIDVLPKGR